MREFGVHSEVGKLRTVMVCRPGLAHQRLTPGNCKDLLFDDVVWVHEAQKDHYDFVLKMQERGVEVLDLHELLAETLERKEARKFVLDRRITKNTVGLGTAAGVRPWLDALPAKELAEFLIGGIAISDIPDSTLQEAAGGSVRRARLPDSADTEHLVPARPVLLDLQRRHLQSDVSGRRASPRRCCSGRSTSSTRRSRSGNFKIWWGDSDEDLHRRLDGGRRRHAGRQGRRADRYGRAHHAPGGPAGRATAVRRQGARPG